MVTKIDTKQFDELLSGDKAVVCDFFADWCGPCKMLAPVLEKLSEEYGNACFVKVNIDDNFELAARYGIMSIPLVGVFKGGEMVDKTVGYSTEGDMKDFLDKTV